MNLQQHENSKYKGEIEALSGQLQSVRRQEKGALDMTMAQLVKAKYSVSMSEYLTDLGLDSSIDTINNIYTMPDASVRWLIPEIIREAVRSGLRKAPIYPNLISSEQSVSGLTVHMPHINMSDAGPYKVGEAETIPLGDISYGKKDVTIFKVGRGMQISYEVRDYVSIDVFSIFLQDFGVKLGQALDALLIDTLINGEQASGSESAAVIGVETASTLAYRDYLRIWVRMSRIGRTPNVMISGEDVAIDTLDLDEFKERKQGTPDMQLNVKTPVPSSADHYIHGAVPDDQVIMVDPDAAIIKLNAKPLLIETDKIISNQTLETYASLTTGFTTLYRDGRVILDRSIAFSGNGFPTYMDPTAIETAGIESR